MVLTGTCLGLLTELTRNSHDNSAMLMSAGGFEFITNEMSKHPDLSFIQAGCCGILRNLPLRETGEAKAAISLILDAMRNHKEDNMVQFEGCHALLKFCSLFPSLAPSLQSKENVRILCQSQLNCDAQYSDKEDC